MHFDDLETRSAEARSADLIEKLGGQIDLVRNASPYYKAVFKTLDRNDFKSVDDLKKIPVLSKSDLPRLQSENLPFAGLNAIEPQGMANIFRSPGPIWDASGEIGNEGDHWKTARGLCAAGIGKGDIVLNCFSYHWTPAGRMFESGAHAVGAAVIPAGVGQTDLQVEAIEQLGVTTYAGTPDFLQVILDKAKAIGADVSSLNKAMVSGGALFPAMRSAYQKQGIEVLQVYGTADVGIIAYEVAGSDGGLPEGMIVNEGVFVELLDPVTREPVAEGDVGEVVVTNINSVYPLIRFSTGDLSAVLPGASSCGRTNTRLKGWMGRADAITKVRGMFIHPSQVQKVVAGLKQIKSQRLLIDHDGSRDTMTLQCVLSSEVGDKDELRKRLKNALAEACKIKGEVEFVSDLPNENGPIEDRRNYS